jgi:hypothetical protein
MRALGQTKRNADRQLWRRRGHQRCSFCRVEAPIMSSQAPEIENASRMTIVAVAM